MKNILFCHLFRCTAFLTLLTFMACQKESTIINESKVEPSTDKALDYIRQLGYSDSVIKDSGDSYLVAGDIMFKKNETYDLNWRDNTNPTRLQIRQYGNTESQITFLSHCNQRFVCQYLQAQVTPILYKLLIP